MSIFKKNTSFFLVAMWWGSLTTLGFMVVPLLFSRMDSMQAAGKMAAVFFTAQDYLSWVCGALLSLIYMTNKPFD